MKDVNTCAAKDCEKPRFLDYYVCAEHFAFYAAPHYTESMLVNLDKAEPAPYPDFCLYPESIPCVATERAASPRLDGRSVLGWEKDLTEAKAAGSSRSKILR